MSQKKIKAVALISGGLDSMIATKMIVDQGIHVEAINFYTGFCVEGHTHAIRKQDKEKQKRNNALWVAEQLGIKMHIVDVIEEYKDVLINPKYGYGVNMNPCLDCKIFMIKKAKVWAIENGFDFIVTGEVIGQRPMSQLKAKMKIVNEQADVESILLRPLSAKNLPETKAEKEGWVDRSKLLSITGRSRKQQMQMAKDYGYDDYATPAGGCCFLTDKKYSDKLVDLWQARNTREYELDDIMLLKVGRHIRYNSKFKLIVAREEGENNYLHGYKNQFVSVHSESHLGPLSLIDGNFEKQDEEFIARILARFGKGKKEESVVMKFEYLDGTCKELEVKPLAIDEVKKEWYV
ncbi:tRNA (5-methylaminomethyl-2-thiouridylate)-methyltransferase [Francisella adeliensis]|uniref:tRNA (5-methylaminomethyl-2-thiouridylate)-methyltransferase n=1 Tax=Francisella adeliensis TaxID=2007306 RepID=A0A2Z4XZX4_9GAMM|nr:tRNA (5-methylaminomethyl-2-thiouridylate)-methyltransferase [Francisella adeliensis]AXA33993.1 tRNA (5-methylaminomethyl-2-thiouridylate)-methyltransferase [Francisella adeliensis]MBK2085905.1 tRNA (5-methylaminomethyl-2-thiouridylate)-methyltransferase [Francisella adeliensis]MBK2097783.1 tRNA (5-methylaminomethyl-2-thiouridylate)-methyltransferase [Francisella adeliensis]QIW12230.1 tRNA (5-methylaminomethyl-2-thiouridylate)-methyltransferase [Francisella adeliensis]QIW14106.1 tRNA (5-met